MTINPQEQIGGVRLVHVRDFLRRQAGHLWSVQTLCIDMRLALEDAHRLIEVLLGEDYIERNSNGHGEFFCVTSRGATLASASAAGRISRRVAELKLAEFLSRVTEVNESKPFAFTVDRVTVFGSYLSNAEKLSDVDLHVELRPRHKDRILQEKLERERRLATTRTFGNFIEELGWPETEVMLYLKSRSRTIQFASLESPLLDNCERKIVFEQPSTQP